MSDRLYKIAESAGIGVVFAPLPCTGAFCMEQAGCKLIALDKHTRSGSAEERVRLAHELGHCKTESLYEPGTPLIYRMRYERKADSWAIQNLVPASQLVLAVKQGNESVSSLADYFSVTEEFMQKAIKFYSDNKERFFAR